MKSVLFVCMGDICRSPAAAAMLKHTADKMDYQTKLEAESCGIGDWYQGEFPDSRMQRAARLRGVQIQGRSRPFDPSKDFDRFNIILAVDREVLNHLHSFASSPPQKAKLHLVTQQSFCFKNQDIPDPYFEGSAVFERVLEMLEDSCEGWIHAWKKGDA